MIDKIFLSFLFAYSAHCHTVRVCFPKCPPCTAERLSSCTPPPSSCKHVVKEPGCGCCTTCALEEGETCGVYTPYCRLGLECLGENQTVSLLELLNNEGKCKLYTEGDEGHRSKRSPPLNRNRRHSRKRKRHPHFGHLTPLNYDGPCSRHYEAMMTSCIPLPAGTWVPNCDDTGFYKATQCLTSEGILQGECWCGDENGYPLEGTKFIRGNPECSTAIEQ